jgi:hypothetical protein
MFYLIKYHQVNVIEVMSGKLLKEVTEKYIKENSCLAHMIYFKSLLV